MKIEQLSIAGALLITPRLHRDDRGLFYEGYRGDLLADHLGHQPEIVQANASTSRAGVVRGIHYTLRPPLQAKYVMAMSGAFLDFVVDLRIGSPSFGRWQSVLLDDERRQAVYLPEGVGHAFLSLVDGATAMYFVTAAYNPSNELSIYPLDSELALGFPPGQTIHLSSRDREAPTFSSARELGLLPDFYLGPNDRRKVIT